MRSHDAEKMLAQFSKHAVLARATKTNEVRTSDLKKFAEYVGKETKHLDEQIFNITVRESGNLASAWTPFAFYIDKKLSHCGVNSFQLVKNKGEWKIQSLGSVL